ncbi:MAG TPA: zf-HC2 domain-containing protein [Opitutaceae bacterium]|nr:zf-HC2 domain-containing protein [Opitutaceae bacterium]
MKDSEFIELLNLYLDHEISAADAARLEAEVQGSPSRHRVYQDYCRMQKACRMLAEDFTTEVAGADRKIVAFEQAHVSRSNRRRYYLGGAVAAAAACVVAVFGLRRNQVTPVAVPGNAVVQTTPAPVKAELLPVSGQSEAIATAALARNDAEDRANAALSLSRNAQAQALAIAARQTDPQFLWMNHLQLEPIQLPSPNQLQVAPNANSRTSNRNSSKQLPQDVQWIAIRFQK